MHVTADVSLGAIFICISIVTTAVTLGIKLGTLQELVKTHGLMLAEHALRLNRYEDALIRVGGDLQRMMGRVEATQDRLDRNTGMRPGEGGIIAP